MNNSWSREIWRLSALIFLGLIIGLIIDQVAWTLLIATAIYLYWHLRHLYRLDQWLQGKRSGIPENVEGAWADVYYHLYRLQQRNRRRKKRLATMVNRFRASTNALPDAAVIMDEHGNIENWNKTAAELLNLRTQDVNQPITNLIRHPDFVHYFSRDDYSEPIRIESPINDDVKLSMQIVPYGNHQRLLMVRDITRIHKLEEMRKDFIANVSHELRTPLTVISGYLETLLEDDDDWTLHHDKVLSSMMQQTIRMQNIVTDLLLISRLETDVTEHKRQQIDVPAQLHMIYEDAQSLSMGKHTITLECDQDLWLSANHDEIISVFTNLIYNAVKYTQEGGHIIVRWYMNDQGACFEVEDNGPGIAEQHLPRLTERFYRVDVGRSRERGGTGLGLAIVKHVLNRHNSKLEVSSVVGKGSTFRCQFPQSLVIKKEVA